MDSRRTPADGLAAPSARRKLKVPPLAAEPAPSTAETDFLRVLRTIDLNTTRDLETVVSLSEQALTKFVKEESEWQSPTSELSPPPLPSADGPEADHGDRREKLIVMLLQRVCSFMDPTPRTFIRNYYRLVQLKILSTWDHLAQMSPAPTLTLTNGPSSVANFAMSVPRPNLPPTATPLSLITALQSRSLLEKNNHEHGEQGILGLLNTTMSRYRTDFTEEGCIGKGAFGKVFKARHNIDGVVYAVKQITFSNTGFAPVLQRKVLREVTCLAKLDHPNICRYYNAWIEPAWEPQTPDHGLTVATKRRRSPSQGKEGDVASFLQQSHPRLSSGTTSEESSNNGQPKLSSTPRRESALRRNLGLGGYTGGRPDVTPASLAEPHHLHSERDVSEYSLSPIGTGDFSLDESIEDHDHEDSWDSSKAASTQPSPVRSPRALLRKSGSRQTTSDNRSSRTSLHSGKSTDALPNAKAQHKEDFSAFEFPFPFPHDFPPVEEPFTPYGSDTDGSLTHQSGYDTDNTDGDAGINNKHDSLDELEEEITETQHQFSRVKAKKLPSARQRKPSLPKDEAQPSLDAVDGIDFTDPPAVSGRTAALKVDTADEALKDADINALTGRHATMPRGWPMDIRMFVPPQQHSPINIEVEGSTGSESQHASPADPGYAAQQTLPPVPPIASFSLVDKRDTQPTAAITKTPLESHEATAEMVMSITEGLKYHIRLYIQTQLCEGLTLANVVHERHRAVNPELNMMIVHQILSGLQHVHQQGVMHRDLKPSNLFISVMPSVTSPVAEQGSPRTRTKKLLNALCSEELSRHTRFVIKIGDFGLAKDYEFETEPVVTEGSDDKGVHSNHTDSPHQQPLQSQDRSRSNGKSSSKRKNGRRRINGVGTITYSSPEQINGSFYSTRSDIYSLGVIMFELYNVFQTAMERAVSLTNLREGKLPQSFEKRWPEEARLVRMMTNQKPELRPTPLDLLMDPYVAKFGMPHLSHWAPPQHGSHSSPPTSPPSIAFLAQPSPTPKRGPKTHELTEGDPLPLALGATYVHSETKVAWTHADDVSPTRRDVSPKHTDGVSVQQLLKIIAEKDKLIADQKRRIDELERLVADRVSGDGQSNCVPPVPLDSPPSDTSVVI